jgi:hypothetical protein
VSTDIDNRRVQIGSDGRFSLSGIAAGDHVVRALKFPPRGNVRKLENVLSWLPIARTSVPEPTFWAEAAFRLEPGRANEVLLESRVGGRIRGQFRFGRESERPADQDFSATLIFPERADGRFLQSSHALVALPSGEFETVGLPPGRYALTIRRPFPGWSLESMSVPGQHSFDNRIELGGEDVSGVVMTFTRQAIRLSGAVRNRDGRPLQDASVFVYPTDRRLWSEFDAGRPGVRSLRADRYGAYSVTSLQPGEFFVVAVSEGVPEEWQEQRFLESLVPFAERITLRANESRTVDLTATPARSRWGATSSRPESRRRPASSPARSSRRAPAVRP